MQRYRCFALLAFSSLSGCGNQRQATQQSVIGNRCVSAEATAGPTGSVDPATRQTLLYCGAAIDQLARLSTPGASMASALPASCGAAGVTDADIAQLHLLAKPLVSSLDVPRGPEEAQPPFEVDITASGEVFVGGAKLEQVEQVITKAEEALAKNPQLRVTIRADTSVSHGRVMRVVDLLKQAGVTKIAFSAQPIPASSGAVP